MTGGSISIKLQVEVVTAPGESVCVTGNLPELGCWQVAKVVPLHLQNPEANIWSGVIHVPGDQTMEFRYLVAILLEPTIETPETKVIVRRWETNIHPRTLNLVNDLELVNNLPVDVFGCYDGQEKIQQGWLTEETVVQLKLYNNSITIWKGKYRNVSFSVHVSPVDLGKRESEVNIHREDSEQESHMEFGRSNWPVIEIAVMNDAECIFHDQEQFGHLYNSEEYVVFQAQMLKPHTVAYMVDLYVRNMDISSENDQCIPEHMGFCYILPSNMQGTTGTCTMPITGSRQQPIGQLTLEYLVVKPLKNCMCDFRISYARHWKRIRGLDVGHRGSGNARRSDKIENLLENTVASFNYAARHGADMVELDVQLSKDMVPVIYHDYHISISMKKKKVTQEHEKLDVNVKDLTVHQLQMLTLSPSSKGGHNHDFSEDDTEDNQPFPTLKHVLEAVDQHVGFNVEVKSPMQLRDGTWEGDGHFDLNSYMDIILTDLLQHAGSRYILLSCFHPDICTMIRLKQNKYPLLFLTQGVTDKYPPYLDCRTSSIPMATFFCRSAGILGVNAHTEELLRDLSLISFVTSCNLVLFCWGEDNNNRETIQQLKAAGVDGVICDRVDEFASHKQGDIIFLLSPEIKGGEKVAMLEAAGYSSLSESSG
ncbi:glycerophosphocholine phosphodiesterase GPCPD1-like [Limulus polyphemus]|uniref:Glycerophosphocholine phosphodiesterase GPCPD1-like n=1 Tax=Limulus polyphemus TaxID=6850 RepID=A0ABM1T1Q0_LIMPO|nr:glycerophosphocholine phosphodiesterase GPCPD1-like [Limulus polyphemus]XP_013781831.1 glycerophosphocholine phosphodiesterase GPCPD1-like [Limulus polyphemus]XP_013781832.1 glycerophosphocholine phosphodiesterase GPCPD1-like [Limulus polyphemus]XP_022249806.1 glycerophosphocholine phosphodiesterase GPCPD1-like [Limulus polyphemus]XP_022249808.1 glycerophosphocholine phosphodiesterase GPCPD1-like [Limulus polyphemus]XP_022249809.1 glycerophosphocholine phosphodiesterase GPCPD1-like [Limulus